MTRHEGRCHCDAIRVAFESDKPLSPRACQCGFCLRHGARTVSDAEGVATLTLGAAAIRYRFATKTTDYILRARCGVYVAATAEIGGQLYATLNLNAFDDPWPHLAAEPFRYGGESAAAKAERRLARWTPLRYA